MANYPLQLPIIPGTLLPGICFRNEQQRLNSFAAVSYVQIPANLNGVIVSASQPTVEQQNLMWIQVDSFNNAIHQFIFSSQYAAWVWPHPVAPLDGRLVLFDGAAGDVPLLDGGDAGAITATTGAFWKIDVNFTDRIPIGAGTLPDGANSTYFAAGAAYPAMRGVFFVRRTARQFFTS